MDGKAHQFKRIAAGIALVVSISMLAAQSAAAIDGRSPDARAAATTQQAGGGLAVDARSPDTTEASGQAAAVASSSSVVDGQALAIYRQAEQTAAAAASGQGSPVIDVRSPDARDATGSAATSATRTLAVSSGGFDWADFGMGVGVAAGSLLLLAAVAAAALTGRRRNHPSTV